MSWRGGTSAEADDTGTGIEYFDPWAEQGDWGGGGGDAATIVPQRDDGNAEVWIFRDANERSDKEMSGARASV